MTSLPQVVWTGRHTSFRFTNPSLQGTVDVHRPALGIKLATAAGEAIGGSYLGIGRDSALAQSADSPPGDLSDSYLRGRDLVARYRATPNCPCQLTVYWRADPLDTSPPGSPAGISLDLLIQTDRLESEPELLVTSRPAAEEIFALRESGTGALIWPVPESQSAVLDDPGPLVYRVRCDKKGTLLSLVEMVHPSDFQSVEIDLNHSRSPQIDWRLFGQFLEKGVIRRARTRLERVDRDDDLTKAWQRYEQFIDCPIPLTT